MSKLRSSREGITGTGNKHYATDDGLLRGVLASEGPRVYPDNYCLECLKDGRDFEDCFHRHWSQDKNERQDEAV